MVLADDDTCGLAELSASLLTCTGVQQDLIPKGWIANHFRWIVWKLAGLESSYHDRGAFLTPDGVLRQLKHRYDIEIDGSKRSALKLIYEGDASPNNCLILCVAHIDNQVLLIQGFFLSGFWSHPISLGDTET